MGSEEEIGQNSHSPEKCGRDTEVLDAGKAHCLPVSCEPHWDACIVEGAILEDLESSLVRDFVQGLRSIHPRVFGQMDEEDTLRNMRVIAADGKGCLRPTLAGLLALGVYPQKFYPRLVVAFSLFAGNRDEKESLPEKPTFWESRTFVGPIPVMVADALECVERNMRTGAKIEGAFRKDVPDYALSAVREAVANALQHRSYAPQDLGQPVCITMYGDSLEVTSPGSLYGMAAEDLGKPGKTSSRNVFLSAILEATFELTPYKNDVYGNRGLIADNCGRGLTTIESELAREGVQPARIRALPDSFSVSFASRGAHVSGKKNIRGSQLSDTIVEMIGKSGSVSVREIVDSTGFSRTSVANALQRLKKAGRVEATEGRNSPRQRYRLTEK